MEYVLSVAIILLVAVIVIFYIRERRLVSLLERDEFTKLYNKIATEKQINKCLSKEGKGTLFLLDIDNFKEINDKYGHLAGDEKLLSFSKALTENFDKDNSVIGRVGGDEFVIFCPKVNSLADNIEKNLCDIQKKDNILNFSMGITCAQKNDCYKDMFGRADKLLYLAKKEGKNSYKKN